MLHLTRQTINLQQIWIFLPGRCSELRLPLFTQGGFFCAFAAAFLGKEGWRKDACPGLPGRCLAHLCNPELSLSVSSAQFLDAPSTQATLLLQYQTLGWGQLIPSAPQALFGGEIKRCCHWEQNIGAPLPPRQPGTAEPGAYSILFLFFATCYLQAVNAQHEIFNLTSEI